MSFIKRVRHLCGQLAECGVLDDYDEDMIESSLTSPTPQCRNDRRVSTKRGNGCGVLCTWYAKAGIAMMAYMIGPDNSMSRTERGRVDFTAGYFSRG